MYESSSTNPGRSLISMKSRTSFMVDLFNKDIVSIKFNNYILWKGTNEVKFHGVTQNEGFVSFFIWEVPSIPDFYDPRFEDFNRVKDPTRIVSIVSSSLQKFLYSLHASGRDSEIGFSLRIFKTGKKIRIFFIGRVFSQDPNESYNQAHHLRQMFFNSFPRRYFSLQEARDFPESDLLFDFNWVRSIKEILKYEDLLPPKDDFSGKTFYYVPDFFSPNPGSTLMELFRHLEKSEGMILIDINVIPTAFSLVEKEAVNHLIKFLEKKSEKKRYSVSILTGAVDDRRERKMLGRKGGTIGTSWESDVDQNAVKAMEFYRKYGDSVLNSPVFLFSLRILEENPYNRTAEVFASEIFESNGRYNIIDITPSEPEFFEILLSTAILTPSFSCNLRKLWDRPDAPNTIRRFHRLSTVDEVSSFFRIPIPMGEECPGLTLDTGLIRRTAPSAKGRSVKIGNLVEYARPADQSIDLTLDNDIVKHMFIAGMPGSGKTTLAFSILYQLWVDQKIPFIVIEPAKTEYRSLKTIGKFKDGLLIFTPGNESVSPFRFNPFEVMEDVRVGTHIENLMNCFLGAFPLYPPMPTILESAIQEMYEDNDWESFDIGGEDEDLKFPGLDQLYQKVTEKVEEGGYAGEVKSNIEAALRVRIDSLRRGEKGLMFNTYKGIPLSEIMTKPVVFELDDLNDEGKALMTLFILTAVQEYIKANRRSGSNLAHVVLIEEAHNVFPRIPRSGMDENPKTRVINYFVRMLAELRALGEGILVLDQLPSALAPEIIKNTSVKVMHRLTALDDRKEMGATMLLDEGDMRKAAQLSPGESLVYKEGWNKARLIIEPDFKGIHNVGESIPDREVRRLMKSFEDENPGYFLPYEICYYGPCKSCDRKIRRKAERFFRKNRDRIEKFIKALDFWEDAYSIRKPTICQWFLIGLSSAGITEPMELFYCHYVHFQKEMSKYIEMCKRHSNRCFCNDLKNNENIGRILNIASLIVDEEYIENETVGKIYDIFMK